MADPEGFVERSSFADDAGTHVAVRRGLTDGGGAEVYLFSGIPGEFGEGLDPAGTVALADGGLARLVGRDRTWVVVWDAEPPCTPRAVLGNGMGHRRFIAILCDAGLLGSIEGRC